MTHVLDALGRIKEYWGSVALVDLDDYAQGRIIRGGAVDWEAYDASTLGAVLIGTGPDVVSTTTPTFVGLTTHDAGIAVGTGQDIDPTDAAGQDLGNAGARWDLYTQDVIFGGAPGANVITFPDNVADALHYVDDGDVNDYLTFVSMDGSREVVVNEDGIANMDFRVEGSGATHALFVQGSDAHVGVNTGTLLDGVFNMYAPGGTVNITAHTYGAVAVHEASVHCRRARGTPGAEANIQAGDGVGSWYFQGWDLDAVWAGYARVTASVDAINQSGGRLSFAVRDAALSTTEWMVIAMDGTVTLTGAALAFTAASNANLIEIPTAQAIAFKIVDTAPVEYLRTKTVAQLETHFNVGLADIDHIVGASVADAFVVRGSDSQITLGILGAGVVHASAAGVLSSSALVATDLDMGIGDMLFNAADGLLLLGPDGEINATEWWSLRKQKATLSGAFHQEAGRWLGTQGLVVEEATTNLILNPSLEVDTTRWTDFGTTLSRDTTYSVFGVASLKVITDNAAADERAMTLVTAETAADTEYTLSVYMRGSGTVKLWLWDTNGGFQFGGDITLTNVWTRYEITKTFSDGGTRWVGVRTTAQQNVTFYCDGWQLEQQDYTTSYCDGSLGTGYAWTGAAHDSTSTRTVTEVDLDAHVGLISSNATLSFRIVVQMPYDADATWPGISNIVLLDMRAGADNNNRVILYFVPADDKFHVYINGGDRLLSAAQTFAAGDWIDIVATLDFTADDYNICINGLLADNDTTALAAMAGLTLFNLGSTVTPDQQGGLVFSEFAVFDRVLTAIEVAGMYALQRPLVDAGALPN